MKPTLTNHPVYSYRDMLVKFANGQPLNCDQVNFLYQHEKSLSSEGLDPLLKYYLKDYYQKHLHEHSFLLPGEALNKVAVETLKKRLKLSLAQKGKHAQLTFTPQEFETFKSLTYKELILYHGNQLLTGAPFHPGGIPHIIFFQWGNFFGIAKYVVLPEEKALKSNVLIYFEEMQERNIEECIQEYIHAYKNELKPQPPIPHNEKIFEPPVQSMFHIPRLTLTLNSHEDKKE